MGTNRTDSRSVNRSLRKACLAVKEKHQHEHDYKYPEECENIVDQRAGFAASAFKWNEYYDQDGQKYLIPFKINSKDGHFRRFVQLRIKIINDVWRNNGVPLELVFWTSQDAQARFQRTLRL